MKRIAILYFTALLLFLTGVAGAQTTGTSSSSQVSYCTDLFSNSYSGHAIVTNIFNPSANNTSNFFTGILEYSLLIVFLVLVLLAVLYGIGYGFGISKLVEFVKTEYIESFFNILMILVIAGGLATMGNFAAFFANIAQVSASSQIGSGTQGITLTNGVGNLYTTICSNIISTQIIPIIGVFVGTLIVQPLYDLASSASVKIFIGSFGSISLTPLQGLGVFYQLLIFEESPVFVLVFFGIAVIFMFYVIYFLFPLFLYLGVLFRSFPWTRAAGGSFLALFISFYIVLPALYYPFTVFGSNTFGNTQNASPTLCTFEDITNFSGSVTEGAIGVTNYVPTQNCSNSTTGPTALTNAWAFFSTNVLQKFGAFVQAAFGLFLGGANPFITNIDLYSEVIAFAVAKLIGLGIALIISFDLLESLGDLLGSPSLQSGRVLERII